MIIDSHGDVSAHVADALVFQAGEVADVLFVEDVLRRDIPLQVVVVLSAHRGVEQEVVGREGLIVRKMFFGKSIARAEGNI